MKLKFGQCAEWLLLLVHLRYRRDTHNHENNKCACRKIIEYLISSGINPTEMVQVNAKICTPQPEGKSIEVHNLY